MGFHKSISTSAACVHKRATLLIGGIFYYHATLRPGQRSPRFAEILPVESHHPGPTFPWRRPTRTYWPCDAAPGNGRLAPRRATHPAHRREAVRQPVPGPRRPNSRSASGTPADSGRWPASPPPVQPRTLEPPRRWWRPPETFRSTCSNRRVPLDREYASPRADVPVGETEGQ
jgi:hypothetical protein